MKLSGTRRVTILATGSQGDVQPYVALGVGLRRAGYQVRLGAPSSYADLIVRSGLDYRPVPDDHEAEAGAIKDAGARRPPSLVWPFVAARFNPFMTIQRLVRVRKHLAAPLRSVLDSSWDACRDADGIITGYLPVAGRHIAEKLHVPFLWAVTYPVGRTAMFPYFLAPFGLRLGSAYNRLTHIVAEQMFWELQREVVDEWRERRLNLPPLGHSSPYHYHRNRNAPVVYGFSSAMLKKPLDWGPNMEIVGSWFLDPDREWSPPAGLSEFLNEHGQPPVMIGLGSLGRVSGNQLVDLAAPALATADQRGVLVSSDYDETGYKLSSRLYLLKFAPYTWLFPRMAAVIHHGGVGTTAEGLRWGRPTVVVPQHADQCFWGRRVAEICAGPAPIPVDSLTPNRLAQAIRLATTDRGIQASALTASRLMAAEDGVRSVVVRFQSLCPLSD